MIELNAETDFVAKNAEFQELADKVVAAAAAAKPADLEGLKAVDVDGKTVETLVQELSAKIGGSSSCVATSRSTALCRDLPAQACVGPAPRASACSSSTPEGRSCAEAARGAAMQVAALKAKYVTRDEVPADIVENERRIAEQTAKEEGKPEAALPKIVEGRVNGYYKDVVLTEQSSVTDSKKTVKALLDEAGATITRFARFEVGAS
ncbi:translation elongation factor Ts [Rhodococcus hoagii]|nr:translation elongation factor Ts [Prescottella equi]